MPDSTRRCRTPNQKGISDGDHVHAPFSRKGAGRRGMATGGICLCTGGGAGSRAEAYGAGSGGSRIRGTWGTASPGHRESGTIGAETQRGVPSGYRWMVHQGRSFRRVLGVRLITADGSTLRSSLTRPRVAHFLCLRACSDLVK